MRKMRRELMFEEITRPVTEIWKEARRSDANGNIYTVTRQARGFETVHVLKGSYQHA